MAKKTTKANLDDDHGQLRASVEDHLADLPTTDEQADAEEAIEHAERERRLAAVLGDLEAAEMTHHPTAIRLIIKSLRAIVEEIR